MRREANGRRDEFLIAMYQQMWGNVERHILVIWQSVAALFGAFAALALIEKNVVPADLVCALLALVCAWVGAHVIDANYWFARNQVIITNIERQFLTLGDEQMIHPYFRAHRKPDVLDHLSIQAWLAGSVYLLITGWHFFTRVVPGFGESWCDFRPARALPYAVSLVAALLLVRLRNKQLKAYKSLIKNSPGAQVQANS